MNPVIKRTIGFTLVLLASISMLVSMYAIVQVHRIHEPVEQGILNGIDSLEAALDTLGEALTLLQDVLSNTTTLLTSAKTTAVNIAQSVHDTGLMADNLVTLTSDELPLTIASTQTSLGSAQSTAVIIDGILDGLAKIPLIGLDYRPEVPLSTALGQVSTSLDPLYTSLADVSDNLETTSTDLQAVETEIIQISLDIGDTLKNLSEAQEMIISYLEEITVLQIKLSKLREDAPGVIKTAVWAFTILLFSLLVAQLGTLVRGLEMMLEKFPAANPPAPTETSETTPN